TVPPGLTRSACPVKELAMRREPSGAMSRPWAFPPETGRESRRYCVGVPPMLRHANRVSTWLQVPPAQQRLAPWSRRATASTASWVRHSRQSRRSFSPPAVERLETIENVHGGSWLTKESGNTGCRPEQVAGYPSESKGFTPAQVLSAWVR